MKGGAGNDTADYSSRTANLTIGREDFEDVPILNKEGGWASASRAFGEGLDVLIEELNAAGIGTSVHWRPLHMHPLYRERYGYRPEDFPVSTSEWERCISLPIFPSMTSAEIDRVAETVRAIATDHVRRMAV